MFKNFLGIAGFLLLLLTPVESVKMVTHIQKSCLCSSHHFHMTVWKKQWTVKRHRHWMRGVPMAHCLDWTPFPYSYLGKLPPSKVWEEGVGRIDSESLSNFLQNTNFLEIGFVESF